MREINTLYYEENNLIFKEEIVMMNALKEYKEMVWKPSWKWVYKHWKGYLVFLAMSMILPYVCFYWSDIKTFVKSKFKRNKEES